LLTCALNVQSAAASGDIYIRADGSIDPSTSPIQRNVNVYTFTDNIDGQIIVQRDNVVINGASHTLQGTGVETGIDLSSRTNITIQNMAIKTFDDALYLHSSNQITISGTDITDSTDGIRVSDSSNNSIYENNITGNSYEGIYILASSNNAISENNITANTGDGVFVWGSSNNTIFENNISHNWWGITSYYSTNNKIFHNNFINNPSQAYIESSVDIWDEGYPSGGNYWSDYSGTDSFRGPNQNETGSDGIGDDSYIIDVQNKDSYPLMSQYPCIHAIAVQDAKTFPIGKTVVGQGFTARVNVSIVNQGHFVETFNISAYASITVIKTLENVTLNSQNFATITFVLNTSGFLRGNYTVSAVASAVGGEAYTSDNTFADGVILVSFVGDVNGDGKVRVDDVLAVALAFGSNYGQPRYNPNLDINDDLKIRVDDVLATAQNFGQGP
jgi:parallel beta-helix repeat protein